MSVLELARAGTNRACVDCADRPLFGGLRCLPCFQRRCLQNAGEHLFAEPPSPGTYGRGCRCRRCKVKSAEYQRDRRKRT
jgi:hypothetical protein